MQYLVDFIDLVSDAPGSGSHRPVPLSDALANVSQGVAGRHRGFGVVKAPRDFPVGVPKRHAVHDELFSPVGGQEFLTQTARQVLRHRRQPFDEAGGGDKRPRHGVHSLEQEAFIFLHIPIVAERQSF